MILSFAYHLKHLERLRSSRTYTSELGDFLYSSAELRTLQKNVEISLNKFLILLQWEANVAFS